nr:MbcA/ParS/Xre antitoxin family protein [uncultured Tolumonas sp.]
MIVTVERLNTEEVFLPVPDEILQKLNCKIGDGFWISVVQPNIIHLTRCPHADADKNSVVDALRKYFDGDEDAVIRWLYRPSIYLDEKTPISVMSTSAGIERVFELVMRLGHGML